MKKHAIAFIVASLCVCAQAESSGWENRNSSRKMPPPTAELWRAPFEKGMSAFCVDWRGGATGKVSVVDGALRIEKRNDAGMVVVTTAPFPVKPGKIVQGYAACYLEGAVDPLKASGYVRLWSGRENLNWVRKHFGATASDSPLFQRMVNTPPGEFTRKLCRAESGAAGVTAAIVVEGAPSVSVWRDWGAEDAAAADKVWYKRTSDDRRPPDRSGTMMDEAAFDVALAKDVEHSAVMADTPAGGVLTVDGKAVPPVLYKPIPFGMGVPFTGEGRIFEKSGVNLQTVNIRLGVGHGRIGFWSKNGFDCAGAVRRVKDFIRAAYMQNIRVEQIAETMNLDRRYLSRLFKEKTGQSVKEYLSDVRMEEAKRYLKTGVSVTECAHLTGYDDVCNFSKMFKKHTGISPRRFKGEKSPAPDVSKM
jgi:AraC-like DNA-binding protein